VIGDGAVPGGIVVKMVFIDPCTNTVPACLWLGGGPFRHWGCLILGDGLPLGINLDAWPHPLHALNDHPILRLQSVANHTQTVDERPEHHLTVLHGVLAVDDKHEALRLIGPDGLVGKQQCLVALAVRQADARK
jgi:hypothetical protein